MRAVLENVGHDLSVDEFDLLNYFGVVPVQLDRNIPWVYNVSTYEVTTDANRSTLRVKT